MDSNLLVASGSSLVQILDQEGVQPRAAMWVHNRDTDSWRLWIVPARSITDKREFYRRVSQAIAKHRDQLQGIDASDTEYIEDKHPAIAALSKAFRVKGTSSVFLSDNMLNGFFLPDGIVIRMDI